MGGEIHVSASFERFRIKFGHSGFLVGRVVATNVVPGSLGCDTREGLLSLAAQFRRVAARRGIKRAGDGRGALYAHHRLHEAEDRPQLSVRSSAAAISIRSIGISFNGTSLGVPMKLGSGGIEKIWEISLQADEQTALRKSADAVKELVDVIKQKMGAKAAG